MVKKSSRPDKKKQPIATSTATKQEMKELTEWYERAIKHMTEDKIEPILNKTDDKLAEGLSSKGQLEITLAKRCRLLYQILTDWSQGKFDTSWRTVATIAAALSYYVDPFDIIPDLIPVQGYVDDAVIVGLCLESVKDEVNRYLAGKGLSGDDYALSSPACLA